jgi:hypothetical protein
MQRGDRDQNNALQELKNGKEELKSVVEKSGSVAWWVYFCFFQVPACLPATLARPPSPSLLAHLFLFIISFVHQVCFGVGFIMWKKAKDDANKKFL